MKFEHDKFNGIIINIEDVPSDIDKFKIELSNIVSFAQAESKNLVWLTLPISLSHLVPKATELGFVFHNCTDEIAEAKWLDISEFLNDEANASFNRQMVAALHNAEGLAAFEPVNNIGPYKKHETFFARINS